MRSRNFLLAGVAVAALLAADLLVRWRQRVPGPMHPGAAELSGPQSFAAMAARTSPDLAGPRVTVAAERSAAARDAILAAGERVYLGAMFRESDSLIRRWDPARIDQLRIAYVTDDQPDWTLDHREIVRRAFVEWEGVGPDVRFTEVLDTNGANIVVRWLRQFDIDRAGQADLTWDRTGRIQHADIKLALISPGGRFLSPDELHAIALHEIGHALGLPHSEVAGDLMFPTADRPLLTSRDTATFRLLYRLPPSSIKWRASDSTPPR